MKWFAAVIISVSVCSGAMASSFRVTNYDGPTDTTASGHKAKYGLCAADWSHHPPGTIIKLDTGERLVVADSGRKVKGKYHIDRYNPSHKIFPTVSRGYVVSRGGYCRNRKEVYRAVLLAIEKKKNLDAEAQRKAASGNIRKQASSNSGWWGSSDARSNGNGGKNPPRQYFSYSGEVDVLGFSRTPLSPQYPGEQRLTYKAWCLLHGGTCPGSYYQQGWWNLSICWWPLSSGPCRCGSSPSSEDTRNPLERLGQVHEQSHRS